MHCRNTAGFTSCCIRFLLLLLLLPAGASAADRAVLARIAQAKTAAEAGADTLRPIERSLVFLANFDQPDSVYLAKDALLPVTFRADHYRPGKFGQGFFFEKAQWNLLPPAIADVEKDLGGFTAVQGAALADAAGPSGFGNRCLAVTLPTAGDGVKTVPVPVTFTRHLGHEKEVTLTASVSLHGPAGATVSLQAQLVPQPVLDPKTQQPVADAKPDTSTPQTITLTGDWQRVYCWATGDARLKERAAALTITLLAPAGITLLADGLQFEQTNFYAHTGTGPSTWVPGGEKRGDTAVYLRQPAMQQIFPVHAGTVSFWERAPYPVGGAFFTFNEWWHPAWSLDDYVACAGEPKGENQPMYCGGLLAGWNDGQWHHLALAWDAEQQYLYKDGKLLGAKERQDVSVENTLRSFSLKLGGNMHGQLANAVFDEFAVFNTRLSAEEIAALAAAQQPLRMTPAQWAIACTPRTTFYRSEATAQLGVTIQGPTPPANAARPPVLHCEAEIDCSIGELLTLTRHVTLGYGQQPVRFEFSPAQLKPGAYPCRIAVTTRTHGTAYQECTLVIAPAPRKDLYWLTTWDRGAATEDWLQFIRNMGLFSLDTGYTCGEELNRMGAEGFLYNWHYNFGHGDYSPANRAKIAAETREITAQLAPHPNWRGTLVNTETGPGNPPGPEQRATWFDAYVKEQLGFDIPDKGWQILCPNWPTGCAFPAGEKPGPDGIYSKEPATYRFLDWWNNKGGIMWRLNALASAEMRAQRPDLLNWTDPMFFAGEIDDLQGGASWSYTISAETLVAELETGYSLTRGSGKEYYTTLGMDYCAGSWLNVALPDGKQVYLSPTPDDMIQQSWLAVAHIPSDGLTFWNPDGWYYGQKVEPMRWNPSAGIIYAPPGSDQALGQVLKDDLLPLGTMLKGVGNAQRPLALLLPESTQWFAAVEGNWGWGVAHFPNHWKDWVGKSGIPYDIVQDNNITPGALAKYKVIIFPMAQFVSRRVYDELVAAANAGTKIILDHYGKQTYPHMERWDQEYYYWLSAERQKTYGEETKRKLAELRAQLLPEFDAVAAGAEGPLLCNVRAYHGVRYISVVNNHRRPGAYTEWTKKPEFQPYGKAQQATVSIKAPQGSVVYEFISSRKLPATFKDGRLLVTLDLPPHAGRLLCVYPAEARGYATTLPAEAKRGVPCTFAVQLTDAKAQPLAGRQLLAMTVTDPAGARHDESGIYRLEDGKALLPFRPALDDTPGTWTFTFSERTTGLRFERTLTLK